MLINSSSSYFITPKNTKKHESDQNCTIATSRAFSGRVAELRQCFLNLKVMFSFYFLPNL